MANKPHSLDGLIEMNKGTEFGRELEFMRWKEQLQPQWTPYMDFCYIGGIIIGGMAVFLCLVAWSLQLR